MKFGTGQYANRNIKLYSGDPEKEKQLRELDLNIPVLGKTGTANRFTNAAFAGMVPGLKKHENNVSFSDGYILTAYVGFDDNSPMTRNTTRFTGASGALPLWTRFANAIVLNNTYADKMDLVDLCFTSSPNVPLHYPELGQIKVAVNVENGGLMYNQSQSSPSSGSASQMFIVTFGKIKENGEVKLKRYFRPYWQVKEN